MFTTQTPTPSSQSSTNLYSAPLTSQQDITESLIQLLGPQESPSMVGLKIMLDYLKLLPLVIQPVKIFSLNYQAQVLDQQNIFRPFVIDPFHRFTEEQLPSFEYDPYIRYVEISLDQSFCDLKLKKVAQKWGRPMVLLPTKGLFWCHHLSRGMEPLIYDIKGRIIAVKLESGVIVSSLCLGSMLVHLLLEEYLGKIEKPDISNHSLFQVYFVIPEFLRAPLRKYYLKYLDYKSLKEEEKGYFRCQYPLELSGTVIEQLFLYLLTKACPRLYKVQFWPAPFQSAGILTHDIEPTPFAYTKGLSLLKEVIDRHHTARHSICLVARFTKKYLKDPSMLEWLQKQNILSHGYRHVNKTHLPQETVNKMVRISLGILQRKFEGKIKGFRGPRLQRGAKIMKALLDQGIHYSSSCVDSDRENTCTWGGGVGMIHPYFGPISQGGKLFQEELLELPITAPDCVLPLYAGETIERLLMIHENKFKAIHELGGLYNSIIHAGVFGMKDAKNRMTLLKRMMEVIEQTHHCWLTSMDQVYEWWMERKKIQWYWQNDQFHLVIPKRLGQDIQISVVTSNQDKENHCSLSLHDWIENQQVVLSHL